AKGRMARDGTRESVVTISSGSARRRKSALLSDPRLWKGRTAIDTGAPGPVGGAAACGRRVTSQKATPTATRAATAAMGIQLRRTAGGGGAFTAPVAATLLPDSESRFKRLRSALISAAVW